LFVTSNYFLPIITHLKGHLRISRLQNVAEEDAKAAKLIEKKHLDELVLEEYASNPSQQKQRGRIFERLRPHSNLRRLIIVGYGGDRLPDWIGNAVFHRLKFLHLNEGRNCIKLPPLGQLSLLEHLIIENFYQVETVSLELYGEHHLSPMRSFPSLKTLTFRRMWNWKTWSTNEVEISVLA